jgi:hypothetical protein
MAFFDLSLMLIGFNTCDGHLQYKYVIYDFMSLKIVKG